MSDKETAPLILLNVEEAIRIKSPILAKLLPRFVLNYIRRIVHEDGLNDILTRHHGKTGLEFIAGCVSDFNITTRVYGTENLPAEGRFIFASNHPFGGPDGILLMHVMKNHYKEFRFLVNDLLMLVKPLENLFVPINKYGRQSSESVDRASRLYESDMQVLTFPAGMVSRKIKGKVSDLEWKKNFIVKAVQYKRDIIPVYFSGQNSNFFYRLANFRKFFGIKANIEMFYLVDELYKHTNDTVEIYFGKPIPYTTFDKSKSPREWAAWVKDIAYKLKEG